MKRGRDKPRIAGLAAPLGATGGESHEQSPTSEPSQPTERRLQAVDPFCGIGGLSYGLRCRGIDIVAGYDVDPSCGYAYEANNDGANFVESDVCDLSFSDLETHYALVDPDDTLPLHKIAKDVGNAVPVKLAEAKGDATREAANVQ